MNNIGSSANVQAVEWTRAIEAGPRVNAQPEVVALTRAVAAGDPEAFTRFYRQWFDPMLAEAFRVTRRDESFCLDVVQDAMVRVIRIRSLKPMRTADDLRRWLRVVVRSCAYDRLRRESRSRARERRAAAGRDTAAPRGDDELAGRLRWIERELAAMDDRSAEVLLMRHRFGWTLKKIGRALGLKPGAVDRRLRGAVEALRRRAREDVDE